MIDRGALRSASWRSTPRAAAPRCASAPASRGVAIDDDHVQRGRRRRARRCARGRACWPPAAATPCTGRSAWACRTTICTPRSASCRRRAPGWSKCISAAAWRRAGSAGWCRCGAATVAFARVGVMAESRAPEHFARHARARGERWGLEGVQELPRQKILPLSSIARTFRDRLLVVGDAAGLVKPTTGGGIYYSLLSAGLAADVLRAGAGRRRPERAPARGLPAAVEGAAEERARHAAVVPQAGAADVGRPTSRACSSSRAPTASCRSSARRPASTATAA